MEGKSREMSAKTGTSFLVAVPWKTPVRQNLYEVVPVFRSASKATVLPEPARQDPCRKIRPDDSDTWDTPYFTFITNSV